MNYKLKILNLKCYLSDEADGDEVYLKSNGQKIWPEEAKYIVPKEENTPIGLEFIINKGDATASDIEALIELGRKAVKQRFGIKLEPEVRIVGQSRRPIEPEVHDA